MLIARIIRESKGLNLTEMARKMRTSRQQYTHLEQIAVKISADQLVRLFAIFDGDLETFWKLLEIEAEKERKLK